MGRSQDLRVIDPVLTQLLRGYSNADFILDNLFPVVPIDKEGGKIPSWGKEAFKIYNTERAMRAKSNKIPPEARGIVDYATTEHDAVYPLDYREINEDIFNAREHGAYFAQSAIFLKKEYAGAAMARDANNYLPGNKVTLAGNDQWTDTANSTPIDDVETGKEAIRGKIAKRPNTMILGAASYKALKKHPSLIERIKYSQKGIVTVELLKEIFDIPIITIGEGVYVNDAGTMYDIWGDDVILAYIAPTQSNVSRSVYEPGFGYTLRLRNHPIVDTYMEEGGKIENIRATDNYITKIVGSDAGYIIKDTNV